MKDLQNLYEVRKTVRFGFHLDQEAKNCLVSVKEYEFKLDDFIKELRELKEKIQSVFLKEEPTDEDKEVFFNKKLEIDYRWLRTYTKIDFYKWLQRKEEKNKKKKYFLTEVSYLSEHYLSWANEWDSIIKDLEVFSNCDLDKQQRRREVALVLSRLEQRTCFEFIKEFVFAIKQTQKPSLDNSLKTFRGFLETTEEQLQKLVASYLPEQSAGLRVARATCNYYTLNKQPREYEKAIEKKEARFVLFRIKYTLKWLSWLIIE